MAAALEKPRLSATALKLIAAAAMLADHCGALLFPEVLWLRAVGRITFPVMAFFVVEGVRHTSDLRRYLGRLLLFAALSEVPFNLLLMQKAFALQGQNVFFTLFFGALAASIILWNGRKEERVPAALACCFAAELVRSDYGLMGAGLIFLIALSDEREPRSAAGPIFAFTAVFSLAALFSAGEGGSVLPALTLSCAAGSVPLLFCYDGTRGGERHPLLSKYFFYLFYPLHLLVLYAVWLVRGGG